MDMEKMAELVHHLERFLELSEDPMTYTDPYDAKIVKLMLWKYRGRLA